MISRNREHLYERRQSAGRMESVMLVMGVVAWIGAFLGFFSHGWLAGLGMLVLGSVAFALSRLFDLIGDLFTLLPAPEPGTPPPDEGIR